ncbi:MAG TPA: class I SAM-dependent methyltransferase [Gaiellaceae bacterium]|nr:class I SAM-dependent methyltransferase [Gaiellaceae bacterium]
MSLEEAWEAEAARMIAWVRAPGHDSYWYFREGFFDLLPAPGRATLDLGCGEGRVARDLAARGHRVVGIDASPSLVAAACEADRAGEYLVADATALPFDDGAFDLVVAYNSLMDVEDVRGAVREAARVLQRGGCLCLAIVHPVNSAGAFAGGSDESPFVIEGSYLEERRYAETLSRDGLTMTFHSVHRPLAGYAGCLEESGFVVEALREPAAPSEASGRWGVPSVARWRRLPVFLWLRAALR